jgi:FkbH-like protein
MPFGKTPADWELQRALLGRTPRTSTLREVAPGAGRTFRVRCERSMPFEFVSELAAPFLALWDARLELAVSDYDPSLAGALRPAGSEDVLVLWIDWRLHAELQPDAAVAWVASLVAAHRGGSGRTVPVLVNDWPLGGSGNADGAWASRLDESLEAMARATPDCHVIPLERLRREDCTAFFDPRNDAVAHYPFSQAATVHAARLLGAQLLPALALPRLKVLALDLDNTLYAGVLGEDGPAGVRVESGHAALHAQVRRLKDAGFILALCSRNELADVETLFKERKDLGLTLADFAAVHVDWGDKAEHLLQIAARLNLHPSALLFVDDNPAELARVAARAPEVELVLADPAGAETAAVLARHPGLSRLRADEASALRTQDLQASQAREELRAAAKDPREYMARLGMVIDLYESCRDHAGRIHELSNKTNQFNLRLARFTEQQVAEALGPGHLTVTVGLRDSLADSGIIGVLCFRLEGARATTRELLMSCRALGRDVEAVALSWALARLAERGCDRLILEPVEGPRNQPALEFLARLLPDGRREVPIQELRARLDESVSNHPAQVRVHR